MNQASQHWGSLAIGLREESRSPFRNVIKMEISDTRAFVEGLYVEFRRAARRAVAARLVESRGDLLWFIAVQEPGRLTGR
jgi:hypothetical protein